MRRAEAFAADVHTLEGAVAMAGVFSARLSPFIAHLHELDAWDGTGSPPSLDPAVAEAADRDFAELSDLAHRAASPSPEPCNNNNSGGGDVVITFGEGPLGLRLVACGHDERDRGALVESIQADSAAARHGGLEEGMRLVAVAGASGPSFDALAVSFAATMAHLAETPRPVSVTFRAANRPKSPL